MNPKIIVGDIHGSVELLKTLIEEVGPSNRPIIFLGDYVNRGDHSREVIELLLRLQAKGLDMTFLCGNHDFAFLQYLDFQRFDQFALLGGLKTLASYIPEEVREDPHRVLLRAMPEAHVGFLRRLEAYYEDEQLICCHTGVCVDNPDDRRFAQMVLTSHPELFRAQVDRSKLTVCGHYPQADLMPFRRGNFVCLDTGCGTLTNGKLTALFFPEMHFLQVETSGRVLRP